MYAYAYAIRAFAQLTGVTTKALRHYERLGLLAPTRTAGGYRRYTRDDFGHLERILALKSLGLPLRRINAMTQASISLLALRERRSALEQKRLELDRAIAALRSLEEDPTPHAAMQRFIGEAAWERWEIRRRMLAAKIHRAPDRAPASCVELFQSLDAALASDAIERAHTLAVKSRETVDPETFRAWGHRRDWPSGLHAYVATCYDLTPAAWERVVAFLEFQGTR